MKPCARSGAGFGNGESGLEELVWNGLKVWWKDLEWMETWSDVKCLDLNRNWIFDSTALLRMLVRERDWLGYSSRQNNIRGLGFGLDQLHGTFCCSFVVGIAVDSSGLSECFGGSDMVNARGKLLATDSQFLSHIYSLAVSTAGIEKH
eukprot:scaffold101813_cov41-Attheya_sp.AAC.3